MQTDTLLTFCLIPDSRENRGATNENDNNKDDICNGRRYLGIYQTESCHAFESSSFAFCMYFLFHE